LQHKASTSNPVLHFIVEWVVRKGLMDPGLPLPGLPVFNILIGNNSHILRIQAEWYIKSKSFLSLISF
jgi:hypothetical protein